MDYSEFKEHFSILSDTRQARKSTYNFFEVMFQVVTAMLCGKSHLIVNGGLVNAYNMRPNYF
ncbi:hypothetical protein ACPF34_002538 [Vibrio cholerae]